MYIASLGTALVLSGSVLTFQYRNDLVEPESLVEGRLAALTPKEGARGKRDTTLYRTFTSLHFRFILGSGLMVLADWLQGPFLVPMYQSFGLRERDVAFLYSLDYATAIIGGLAAGGVADVIGTRAACLAYGLLYASSCLCNHFSSTFVIVALGCLIDGVCNALLRTGFESWLVAVSKEKGICDEWAQHTQTCAGWWSTVASLAAGIVTQAVVSAAQHWSFSESLSYVATMDAAAILLIAGTLFIYRYWEQDTPVKVADNNKKHHSGGWVVRVFGTLQAGSANIAAGTDAVWRAPASQQTLMLCEVLFEALLLTFVGVYPMAILAVDPAAPMGVAFVSLMASILLGSSVAGLCEAASVRVLAGWRVMCAIAAVATGGVLFALWDTAISGTMTAAAVADNMTTASSVDANKASLVFGCLCALEACFGYYYPQLAALHRVYAADGLRNSCVAIVRSGAYVLALAVLAFLYLTEDVRTSWIAMFLMCAASLMASTMALR